MTQEKLLSGQPQNVQECIQNPSTLNANEVKIIKNDIKGKQDNLTGMYPGYFCFDEWDQWYPDPS